MVPEHVTIERLELRTLPERALREFYDLEEMRSVEATPGEPPRDFEEFAASVRTVPDFIEVALFLARDASGLAVGQCEGAFVHAPENPDLVQLSIFVRPERRRLGIGRALLAHGVGFASSHGRTVLTGVAIERIPAGRAFARRVGAEAALTSHVNRLMLADVDRVLIEAWIAEGPVRAPGYSLVHVDGRCPDELVEEVVALLDVMDDAPSGDVQMADQHTTVEQLRDREHQREATGDVHWWTFAKHDLTGRLVGLTEVTWNPSGPETVGQGDTGVRAEHRGHALGKWMKATTLRRILDERPGCEDVRTRNADTNAAMLGINAELGFEPYVAQTSWQVGLERAREYLRG